MSSSEERMDVVLGAVNDFSKEFKQWQAGMQKNAKTTTKATAKTKSFSGASKLAKKAMIGMAAAVVGGSLSIAGFTLAVTKAIGNLSELNKEAKKVGLTAEELSRLAFIGESTGVELDDIIGSVEELRLRMAEASQDGAGPLNDTFKKLGLNVDDFIKMPVAQQLGLIGDELNTLHAADRQFLADEIFGGDAVRMMGFLAQGSKGIEKLSKRSDELGITVSNSSAAGAAEFTRNWNEMLTVAKRIFQRMLLPVIEFGKHLFVFLRNALTNWQTTWDLIVDSTKLAFVTIFQQTFHFATKSTPAILKWLFGVWQKTYFDIARMIQAVMTNIVENMKKSFDLIGTVAKNAIAGKSNANTFKKLGSVWGTNLLEGFKASTHDKLEIPKREITSFEKKLHNDIAAGFLKLSANGATEVKAGFDATPAGKDRLKRQADGQKGVGQTIFEGIAAGIKKKIDAGLGPGFKGQLAGKDDRFLQTGKSIQTNSPAEQTASNTKVMKKEIKDMGKGVTKTLELFQGVLGKGGALRVSLLDAIETTEGV